MYNLAHMCLCSTCLEMETVGYSFWLFPVGYSFGEAGGAGRRGREGVLEQRRLVCRVLSFIPSLSCMLQGGHSPPFCLCSREQLQASPHLFMGVEPFACVFLDYCFFR